MSGIDREKKGKDERKLQFLHWDGPPYLRPYNEHLFTQCVPPPGVDAAKYRMPTI